MIAISIRADLKPLQKAFGDLRSKQLPFANSLALNALAQGTREQEKVEIAAVFDRPTPFTVNAYSIVAATKASQVAVVFAKDIQAEYLEPYIEGGDRSLGTKKGMLVPREVGTNQYGNLTRGKLQALKGKPGVFIGSITAKGSGRVTSGVWMRPIGKATTKLKLLIQFEDTTPAPKHLDFYERAQKYIHANVASAFNDALTKALATARR